MRHCEPLLLHKGSLLDDRICTKCRMAAPRENHRSSRHIKVVLSCAVLHDCRYKHDIDQICILVLLEIEPQGAPSRQILGNISRLRDIDPHSWKSSTARADLVSCCTVYVEMRSQDKIGRILSSIFSCDFYAVERVTARVQERPLGYPNAVNSRLHAVRRWAVHLQDYVVSPHNIASQVDDLAVVICAKILPPSLGSRGQIIARVILGKAYRKRSPWLPGRV